MGLLARVHPPTNLSHLTASSTPPPTELHDASKQDQVQLATRCSPKQLVKLFAELSDEQKQEVTNLGFGPLLQLQVRRMDLTVARFAVDSFDPVTAVLKLNGKTRAVTPYDVAEVLGLCNDGPPVPLQGPASEIQGLLTIDTLRGDISCNAMEAWLQEQQGVVNDSVRSVLVLVIIGRFLCPAAGASMSKDYLHSVANVKEISTYNWSALVFQKLKEGIGSFKSENQRYVRGCIFFLMVLLVNNINLSVYVVAPPRMQPLFVRWGEDNIRKLCHLVARNGGFHSNQVSFMDIPRTMNHTRNEDKSRDEQLIINEVRSMNDSLRNEMRDCISRLGDELKEYIDGCVKRCMDELMLKIRLDFGRTEADPNAEQDEARARHAGAQLDKDMPGIPGGHDFGASPSHHEPVRQETVDKGNPPYVGEQLHESVNSQQHLPSHGVAPSPKRVQTHKRTKHNSSHPPAVEIVHLDSASNSNRVCTRSQADRSDAPVLNRARVDPAVQKKRPAPLGKRKKKNPEFAPYPTIVRDAIPKAAVQPHDRPLLSGDELAVVTYVLDEAAPSLQHTEIVEDSHHFLTREELLSLRPEKWVVDSVLTMYACKCNAEERKGSNSWSRWFWPTWFGQHVQQCSVKDDHAEMHHKLSDHNKYMARFEDCDEIYIPTNVTWNHWILMVVKVKEQKIIVFDTMNPRRASKGMIIRVAKATARCIAQMRACEARRPHRQDKVWGQMGKWPIQLPSWVPDQLMNSGMADCGIYVMKFMDARGDEDVIKNTVTSFHDSFKLIADLILWDENKVRSSVLEIAKDHYQNVDR